MKVASPQPTRQGTASEGSRPINEICVKSTVINQERR